MLPAPSSDIARKPAAQAQVHLEVGVLPGKRLDQVDRAREVRAGLLERTAPPGRLGGLPVRVRRLLVALGALEVRRDHEPVAGLLPGQEVAETAVDLAAPGGRLQLVGDLAKELVPELVAVRATCDRLQDLCVEEASAASSRAPRREAVIVAASSERSTSCPAAAAVAATGSADGVA